MHIMANPGVSDALVSAAAKTPLPLRAHLFVGHDQQGCPHQVVRAQHLVKSSLQAQAAHVSTAQLGHQQAYGWCKCSSVQRHVGLADTVYASTLGLQKHSPTRLWGITSLLRPAAVPQDVVQVLQTSMHANLYMRFFGLFTLSMLCTQPTLLLLSVQHFVV